MGEMPDRAKGARSETQGVNGFLNCDCLYLRIMVRLCVIMVASMMPMVDSIDAERLNGW